jgi:hypothetical protein
VAASLMAMTFTTAKSQSRPKNDCYVGCETTVKGASVVVVTLFGSGGYTVGVTGTPVGSGVLGLAVRKCCTSSTGSPLAWRTLRFFVHDRFGC